jgi:hypothetical protein
MIQVFLSLSHVLLKLLHVESRGCGREFVAEAGYMVDVIEGRVGTFEDATVRGQI